MNRLNPIALTLASAGLAFFVAAGGCDKGDSHEHAQGSHDHDHDHDHDHAEHAMGHHHGEVIELGEQSAGGMTIKASRDGDVKAGGDVPIDIWIDGGLGGASSVRFWIGSEDAKGSVKAKAEDEDGHWHTHCEAPSPMPEGSKLWVEIEKGGERQVVGFDLKG
ncbi:MAG: hypothetical protein ACO38W_01605 [Phycisphaerales bacterium]